MNEATVVAAEIQDLASAVGDVAEAVRNQPDPAITVNVPEQPPPVVNVTVSPAEQPAPQVTVNVPQQAAPVVNVAAAQVKPQISFLPHLPSSYEVEVIERDGNGFIKRFTINPI